jgi:hypothetical protein
VSFFFIQNGETSVINNNKIKTIALHCNGFNQSGVNYVIQALESNYSIKSFNTGDGDPSFRSPLLFASWYESLTNTIKEITRRNEKLQSLRPAILAKKRQIAFYLLLLQPELIKKFNKLPISKEILFRIADLTDTRFKLQK